MAEAVEVGGSRQERRKGETRRRVLAAADALFDDRGYAETSIEDIAARADVAVRAIYLHFPSKAAIMLAYVDEWLDAFVAAIIERPLDEPVVESVRAALESMSAVGWTDRVEGGDRVHPIVDHLDSGSPDIAGHVMQRWMLAIGSLTADAVQRDGDEASWLRSHARAIAVFAAWVGALSAAREGQRGRPPPADATGNGLGLEILAQLTSGSL